MKEQNHLAENLRNYMEMRKISMKEFADELDMPISTLRAVLKEGNTTLHTAMHISQRLGISIDMLISDQNLSEKLFIMNHMQKLIKWFGELSSEKQERVAALMAEIWTALDQ